MIKPLIKIKNTVTPKRDEAKSIIPYGWQKAFDIFKKIKDEWRIVSDRTS